MARNSAPGSVWEESATSTISKSIGYLRCPAGDGFMHFSPDGPNDADVVEDTGDNFWHMTASAGGANTTTFIEVGGFVHLLGIKV